ncbi:winged helix-turn-helix transcriptional regulator [Actinoalloteichus caeruleus]|uniref:Transcriptional regulator, HxlR family n=1 Tax=Actinoalloteichus caeruleus DSM 43889 TaxID=1120930 RepID=A0ABT1JEG4_ACTCY|nr:helix-turn-helix domain-containing protein [Actinoalloteichus caeruleus]MCP2330892.1 transcriptional regulator, HxlR family [Actinoalloteichus caeruleus DSM 43889]
MQRTRFGDMPCSIARTWNVIGEPWSPLILRDIYVGVRRFDDLQASLGISRKVLAERLAWLVDQQVLDRHPYTNRPTRHEYVLTPRGAELCDALLVLAGWGDRWLAGEDGPPALFRHRSCGEASNVTLHCSHCDQPMTAADVDVLDGPGAPAREETP